MKKQLKNGMVLLLLLCMAMNTFASVRSEAASKNKKAGSAFAKAVTAGKISYNAATGELPYEKGDLAIIDDLDKDGVKELAIIHHKPSCPSFSIWKYAEGKVFKLASWNKASFLTEHFGWGCYMLYDKKNKVFWCMGEAEGGWMAGYQLTGKKIKEKVIYDAYLASSGKFKVKKIVNGKSTEIKMKKYDTLRENMLKNGNIQTMSKTKLVQKLTGMK